MTTPANNSSSQVDINDVVKELLSTPEGKVQWELAQLRAVAQAQFREIEQLKVQVQNLTNGQPRMTKS